MPRFDWLSFVKRHHIDYVTSGPNFARKINAVNIKCPFCGASDPSEHMGLTKNGGWWCLRNSAHRGKSPVRLVRQLLHCSEQEARRLVGGTETATPTADDLTSSLAALRGTDDVPTSSDLALPPEFKPLLSGSPLAQPFISYLERRGYRPSHIKWLCQHYNLRYATSGLYAGRLIIPIYDRYGDLLSWTARTIRADTQPRYRTLRMTADDDGPVAKLAANNTLLGLPLLWSVENPRALIVVEGPFDALKVTAYGQAFGVYATCLFGLNVYPSQVGELQELSTRFSNIYLLIDEDAELQRLRLLNALGPVGCKPLKMPEGSDDPGALSGAEVTRISLELAL